MVENNKRMNTLEKATIGALLVTGSVFGYRAIWGWGDDLDTGAPTPAEQTSEKKLAPGLELNDDTCTRLSGILDILYDNPTKRDLMVSADVLHESLIGDQTSLSDTPANVATMGAIDALGAAGPSGGSSELTLEQLQALPDGSGLVLTARTATQNAFDVGCVSPTG